MQRAFQSNATPQNNEQNRFAASTATFAQELPVQLPHTSMIAKHHGMFPRAAAFAGALALLAALALPNPGAVLAKDTAAITAEEIFRQLPTSIFDNTSEPLSDESKQKLLDNGYTSNWVIVQKTPDTLRMSASSDGTNEVTVLLLRSSPGGVAVLGAKTSDSCAAELWGYNAHGGIVPYTGPQEPSPSEFFSAERGFPPGIMPSYRLCLEDNALEAKPLFWNDEGLADITPDNRVLFVWNGKEFVKQVIPATMAVAPAPADTPLTGAPVILGVPAPVAPAPEIITVPAVPGGAPAVPETVPLPHTAPQKHGANGTTP